MNVEQKLDRVEKMTKCDEIQWDEEGTTQLDIRLSLNYLL